MSRRPSDEAVVSRARREPAAPVVRSRPPVVDALRLGQQLATASGAARALIERTPTHLGVLIQSLRPWYYHQHPDERDRLLWRRVEEAAQTHSRLDDAIKRAREALDEERHALTAAEAERETLATHPMPTTVEEEARAARSEAVSRYQSVAKECQQRHAAIAELERLLPLAEQSLRPLLEATTRILEAVATVNREASVRRLGESGELEQLRARFERLRTMANTHEAELAEWSQRAGRLLRVPRIDFPWPAATAWKALLDTPVEAPRLVWSDAPNSPDA